MQRIVEGGKRIGRIGLLRRNVLWFGEKKEEGNGKNENKQRKGRNIIKTIGFGICAASLAYFLYNTNKSTNSLNLVLEDPKPLKSCKIQLGGEWQLQDCSQNLFSSDQLKGNFYLIYFGYAFCPDICPTTLNYIGNVYRQYQNLNQNPNNLKVVFVSVDPKRDKPETVKKYLRLFDPSFIGLTAKDQNDENFKDITKKFKIYANKIQGEGDSYNIDHTSLVFLMGPNGQFIDLLNTSLPERQTVQFLITRLQTYPQTTPKS